MPTLSLNFLGPPHILLDDTPVTFESRKAVALLAYLAVMDDRHTRSELMLLLWPESDNKRARGALRYTLSIIKTALGDGWLVMDRQQISLLDPDETRERTEEERIISSDVHRFRSLLATRALPDGRPGAAAATALYRDDFLAGFSLRDSVNFEEWHFFQREDFRHQMVGALAELTEKAGSAGNTASAIGHARRLLQLDPLREDIQRSLMRLLAGRGQNAAALQQFDEFARRLDQELGVPPSSATAALAAQIRAGTYNAHPEAILHTPPPVPNNLSTPMGQVIGRETELQALRDRLADDECRLLTLIGAGGMGKTRLARQIAADYVDPSGSWSESVPHPFPDGVYFVALATIESRALLIGAIAAAIDLQFAGSDPPQTQLTSALQSQQMLLILDNFEQLAGEAPIVSELLAAAPGLKALITSRERLKLYAEWLFEVAGLAVPGMESNMASEDPGGTRLSFGSVQLFSQRARRINPGFQPEPVMDDVVRICRLVQGMPLGIELAAGWIRLLSAGAIADQIQANLDFLVTELQDVPQRHRSLRAVYRYSSRRLTDQERAVFARLAIFRGGFTREAAGEVAGATQLMLARLVDKSMIQRAARESGAPTGPGGRYLIHELLRQFGQEELTGAARRAACGVHARYFAGMLQKLATARWRSEEGEALARIESELDNVIAAWEWLVDEVRRAGPTADALDLLLAAAPMLGCFLQRRSRFEEGCDLFRGALSAAADASITDEPIPANGLTAALRVYLAEQLFALSEFEQVLDLCRNVQPPLRAANLAHTAAEALWLCGSAHVRMGDYAAAEVELRESLETFRMIGDEAASTRALNALGIAYSNQGKYAQARPFYEEFLAAARDAGYLRGVANALNNLGSNYARAGDHDQALTFYRESYQLSLQCGEQLLIAVALSNLGSVSRALGEHKQAQRYYTESLKISRAIGVRRWTSANLNGLGLTLVEAGAYAEAGSILAESLLLAREIGSKPDALEALATAGDLLAATGQLEVAQRLWRYVAEHPNSMSQAQHRCRQQLAALSVQEAAGEPVEQDVIETDSNVEIDVIIDQIYARLERDDPGGDNRETNNA
ncbi:MAG: tetratricopeptide repeat protein [Caldilineaceae bacterium]|nr:tetratricopeptide repeat protein [Caldilineaceae bacterium]